MAFYGYPPPPPGWGVHVAYPAHQGYPQPTPQPILNPANPYIGQIKGGMRPGKMITISGTIPRNPNRFHINLQVGASTQPRADVAFHLAVRIKEGAIVRNTLEKEKWQSEEREVTSFPFRAGENFEVMILAEKEGYKVAVNGKHFLEYKHRVKPLRKIDTLHVNGDVQIKSILLPLETGPAAGPGAPMAGHGTIMNPALPYTSSIPGGMYPGRMIFVTGSITPSPERFHINLTPATGGAENIALHFNPRFPNRVIVCNTKQANKWGAEERNAPFFPFEPNTNFEVIILCQQDCFKVAVNGRHLLEYRHRMPYQNVASMNVAGNACHISQIRFQ